MNKFLLEVEAHKVYKWFPRVVQLFIADFREFNWLGRIAMTVLSGVVLYCLTVVVIAYPFSMIPLAIFWFMYEKDGTLANALKPVVLKILKELVLLILRIIFVVLVTPFVLLALALIILLFVVAGKFEVKEA